MPESADNNWSNAVKEFNEFLDHNPNVKSSLYKLSATNANIYNNPQVQEGFRSAEVDNGMTLSVSALTFFTETLQHIDTNFKKSDELKLDLNHFIDERIQLLNAIEENKEMGLIDLNQSFREIAISTNRSLEQELIFQTAKAFLEPFEMANAITNNVNVGDVLGEIDRSRIRNFMNIFMGEEKTQERVDAVETKQNNLENFFSADISYAAGLDKKVESVAVSADKSPDVTPKVAVNDRGIER